MADIFRIYASQGRNNYAELDLPASDYEMLDLMERLRLEPGQLPYVEVLKVREQYDYLEKCIHELPDIYQLNALAKKLSELTSTQDMAAFEGLVGKEIQQRSIPIALPRLIDFAYSTEGCVLADGAMTDFQLGKFLVDNDFIEEANGLPESMIALLDFAKIGRERREAEGGVFTGFGYVEQLSEVRHVSETMDFQPQKPAYTILVNMAALPLEGMIRQEDMVQLRLPAPEAQVREAMDKLGERDWHNVAVSIWDSPIPRLNHELNLSGEMPLILELAQRLSELDEQGESLKYKAVLAMEDTKDLSRMLNLAGTLDEYLLEMRVASPEDVARDELGVVMSEQDMETLLPHVDLIGYGRALLERDQAIITNYGLVEHERPQQVMEQADAPEGMVMI